MPRKKKYVPKRTRLEREYIDIFQVWIRWRDDFVCITCGKKVDPHCSDAKKLMHAGHYINRSEPWVKYDEENVNAQCRDCNGREHNRPGYKNLYATKLIEKYGEGVLERLQAKKNTYNKISTGEFEELIDLRKAQIEELKACRT